jgi:hypothetical protein
MAEMDEKTAIAFEQWQNSQKNAKQESAGQASGDDEPSMAKSSESEDDRIAAAVQKALADERERVGASAPLSVVPNHGGGIGVDAHEGTWSLYDQELASAGEHPLQTNA